MKLERNVRVFATGLLVVFALLTIILNFRQLFPALGPGSLTYPENKSDKPIDIPSNLNFLNDDKKTFVSYCQQIYGANLPAGIDSGSFVYYGTVDGYRLYRMQESSISCGPAYQKEKIDGYFFESDALYRPCRIGLYLISDQKVYSINKAYSENLVNIKDVYDLYNSKTFPAKSAVPAKDNIYKNGKPIAK